MDPKGKILPKSDWIHVNGVLPICSLEDVLSSFEKMLRQEEARGIVDLDAPWNPVQDEAVPTITLDNLNTPMVEAAHVVVSPFGRPNGWYLKFANRSLANAILTRSQETEIRVAWKLVQVQEYYYHKEKENANDPAYANGLVVDDSMLRYESRQI